MKAPRPLSPPTVSPVREIQRDTLYPLREVSRRLGWGARCQADAVRQGLRCVRFGRTLYVFGFDIHTFFAKLRDQQDGRTAKESDQCR